VAIVLDNPSLWGRGRASVTKMWQNVTWIEAVFKSVTLNLCLIFTRNHSKGGMWKCLLSHKGRVGSLKNTSFSKKSDIFPVGGSSQRRCHRLTERILISDIYLMFTLRSSLNHSFLWWVNRLTQNWRKTHRNQFYKFRYLFSSFLHLYVLCQPKIVNL